MNPTQATGVKSPHIEVIDQLRGLAALSVAIFHFTEMAEIAAIRAAGSYLYLGLDVFFVISGFVIPLSLFNNYKTYRPQDYLQFIAVRAARLEPPYLVSMLLAIVSSMAITMAGFGDASDEPITVARVLFHVAYLIPFTEYEWLVGVYWTLAYEFAFYLIVGALFLLLVQADWRVLFLTIVALVLIGVATGVVPERSPQFIIGIAAFRIWAGKSGWIEGTVLIAASIAALAAAGLMVEATAGTITALLILWSPALSNAAPRLATVLIGLGAISYSLYLLHLIIGGRVASIMLLLGDGVIWNIVMVIVSLAASIIAAVVFWALVERPSIRFARAFRRSWQATEVRSV